MLLHVRMILSWLLTLSATITSAMIQTASPAVLSLHILVKLIRDQTLTTLEVPSATAFSAVEFSMDQKLPIQKPLSRKAHLAQNLSVAFYLYPIRAT